MARTSVNGARLHYHIEGDAALTPVVLVHPIGADHRFWDKVVPLLIPWALVLRFDLRGHGGSEATEGDYSLGLMASDLLALTEQVRMERFVAVGVSLGALTVLEAAARAPRRVHALAACSVAARIAPPPQGWDGRARAVRELGTAHLAQGMAERMFSAPFRQTRDPAIEAVQATLARMDRQGYASACAVLRDGDVSDVLPTIRQPVVIVSGAEDAATPPVAARELAGLLPRARYEVLSGGHFPPLERPAEFAQLLRDVAVEGATVASDTPCG
jgi:3-oxoadipate enol-lactonase